MKKKIIISAVAILILIAAVFAGISIHNKLREPEDGEEIYQSIEDAEKIAAFRMNYPDRLGGIPVTGFKSNSSMIEARYGEENYIRKTLGVADNSGNQTEYREIGEQQINGRAITFRGSDGLVYLATWNDNNFAYTVNVTGGVSAEEMAEYIEATR